GCGAWLLEVRTAHPRLASAFSASAEMLGRANGGIWASGGPSVDSEGNVWAVTGNSPPNLLERTWGVAVVRWAAALPLRLPGTYTPWNHCQLDTGDIALCGSGVSLLPAVRGTSTPRMA